jgi:hypothetical protein
MINSTPFPDDSIPNLDAVGAFEPSGRPAQAYLAARTALAETEVGASGDIGGLTDAQALARLVDFDRHHHAFWTLWLQSTWDGRAALAVLAGHPVAPRDRVAAIKRVAASALAVAAAEQQRIGEAAR